MKLQDAINTLESIYPSQKEIVTGEYPDVAESIDMAIKALEKQMPRKPNLKDVGTDQWLECPSCYDTKIDDEGTEYCSACGQKLDWSEFV